MKYSIAPCEGMQEINRIAKVLVPTLLVKLISYTSENALFSMCHIITSPKPSIQLPNTIGHAQQQ